MQKRYNETEWSAQEGERESKGSISTLNTHLKSMLNNKG